MTGIIFSSSFFPFFIFKFYFTWLCQTDRLGLRLHSPQFSFFCSLLCEFLQGEWCYLSYTPVVTMTHSHIMGLQSNSCIRACSVGTCLGLTSNQRQSFGLRRVVISSAQHHTSRMTLSWRYTSGGLTLGSESIHFVSHTPPSRS